MLTGRGRSLTAIIAALAAVFVCPVPLSWAEESGTDVSVCQQVWVCAGVEVPGNQEKPGTAPGRGGGSPGRHDGESSPSKGTIGSPRCTKGAPKVGEVPCHVDGIGDMGPTGCYYAKVQPQPPAGDPVWQGHQPGDGAIYMRTCVQIDAPGLLDFPVPVSGAVWMEDPPTGAQGPSAEELARQAYSKMHLGPAQIGSAPRAGSKGLVGMPVWLWTRETPNSWGPVTATASAGGLSVTARAHVKGITWSMGDGASVRCSKPGTPYRKAFGKRDSPDCGHRYSKVPPSGGYTVTATSTWVITWEASNGESGTLPDQTRTAATTVRIGELQVVN